MDGFNFNLSNLPPFQTPSTSSSRGSLDLSRRQSFAWKGLVEASMGPHQEAQVSRVADQCLVIVRMLLWSLRLLWCLKVFPWLHKHPWCPWQEGIIGRWGPEKVEAQVATSSKHFSLLVTHLANLFQFHSDKYFILYRCRYKCLL